MNISFLYIHIGKSIPDYFIDSVYQLSHLPPRKIYILVNHCNIDYIYEELSKLNVTQEFINNFNLIPLELFNVASLFPHYSSSLSINKEFRQGFWYYTTLRFIYIYAFMKEFCLCNILHLENDVMLYNIPEIAANASTMFVRDAVNRVIPSLVFFKSPENAYQLCTHIENHFQGTSNFKNDMELLSDFAHDYKSSYFNIDPLGNDKLYDGAALGQLLDGVDPRNINLTTPSQIYNNPSKGFVNETCVVKYNIDKVYTKNVVIHDAGKLSKAYYYDTMHGQKLIYNLHIHSKQLYKFSSIFGYNFQNIITGDRVLSLADYIICSINVYRFHKNMALFNKNIILVRNFKQPNLDSLNEILLKSGKRVVKLCIYTHEIDDFVNNILEHLNKSLKYVIYIHNSDNEFNNSHSCLKLVRDDNIIKIYSQNLNINTSGLKKIETKKLHFLPIGLANSMWPHGNLEIFYEVLKNTYKYKKTKNLYININPSTNSYRAEVLEHIIKHNEDFEISEPAPYRDYLYELSKHRFCLCIRGNGIDTHRFWEALYLGVVPIIITNSKTDSSDFVNHISACNIPFVNIQIDDTEYIIKKYNNMYFNEKLYNKIISPYQIYNLSALDINSYSS